MSSKWVKKAAETILNISSASGPGTTNECTVQWWFRKFHKGDESLEDDRSGWPSEVDNDQLRAIIEADPLRTTQEVAQELNINHSLVIWHLKQIRKVEKLDKLIAHAAAAAKSLQSCLTLCDPIDDSPPGSPIPGILQARTLEWVAISFSGT